MSELNNKPAEPVSNMDAAGRYLYCLVDLRRVDIDGIDRFSHSGIENKPVSLITADSRGIGALVHTREEPYDSEDIKELRDWLLNHQNVVESAGREFGTPLPVRFNTIITGNNETVISWVKQHSKNIQDALDKIENHWEYRVTLSWNTSTFESNQQKAQPELAQIHSQLEQSTDGKRFLLQKQYKQRLRELCRERQAELKKELISRLSDTCSKVTERPLNSDAAAMLDVEVTADAVVQLALLAAPDNESAIGDILDDMLEIDGVGIRFTGPWPPYTFSPTIGDE
jgi:hypothetical protein